MKPRVTVLLPVYNGASHHLRSAVESILAQTFREFRLIVVDDGSTDETPQMLADFAAADDRVDVMRTEHRGVTRALALGLSRADSELVARIDADDAARPDRLATQLEFLRWNPAAAVVGSWYHLVEEFGAIRPITLPTEPAQLRRRLIRANALHHASVVFRRAAILDAGGYDPRLRYAQDYDLWLRVAARHDLANVPEFLLSSRRRSDSITEARRWEQRWCAARARVAAMRRRTYGPASLYFAFCGMLPALAPRPLVERVRLHRSRRQAAA